MAPKLVDMKRTEADKKAERAMYEDSPYISGEDYAYGLTIRLDNAQLDKLKLGDMDVGPDNKVRVVALGVITEESSNTYNGKTRRSMSIQLQQIAIEPEGEAEDPAKVLYNAD